MPEPPHSVDPVQLRAYFALVEVSGLLRHAIEKQLQEDGGLTFVRFQILRRLQLSPTGSHRMTDLADLTATETLARLRAGRTTPGEVGEALAARVAAREPVVRAFAHRDGPPAPGAHGPLAGLQIGVKDVLDTADLPTEYGSPIWAGHRPRADAEARFLIVGTTITSSAAGGKPDWSVGGGAPPAGDPG